jgi:hypothetical protein
MSGIEHYKGTLKPTGKSIEDYIKDDDIPEYYDGDWREYFEEHYNETAIFTEGQVYEIEKISYEDDQDISISSENEDKTIDFEVKFHNGGCGFNAALTDALKNKT